MIVKRIREKKIKGRRLGRFVFHDPRSRAFVAHLAPKIITVTHEAHGLPLDQGQLGSCTGNAAAGAMNCAPYYTGTLRNEAFAVDLYHRETVLYPQNGVYPPDDPGGCGLWVAKVLKNEGLIKSYSHAFGLNEAILAVCARPCIFGFPWYSSFDEPNKDGKVTIRRGATIRGGHEVLANGVDATKKLVWFWNSWGKDYGLGGRFCMSFYTLGRLLKQQGDCTQFTK